MCTRENYVRVQRAFSLWPVDQCVHEVVAATDDKVTLFAVMSCLGDSGLRTAVQTLMFPPPLGEAPHVKSPEAVQDTFERFERVNPLRADDIKYAVKDAWSASTTGAAKQQKQPPDVPTSVVGTPTPVNDADPQAVKRGGFKLAALVLACVAVWRIAAAAERRAHGRPHAS